MDISPDVMEQLEEAQAAVLAAESRVGPPIAAGAMTSETDGIGLSDGGNGQVSYLLVYHYFAFNVPLAYLWVRAGDWWRSTKLSSDDEQGIVKVAFEADRVDAYWAGDEVTTLRCWKTF